MKKLIIVLLLLLSNDLFANYITNGDIEAGLTGFKNTSSGTMSLDTVNFNSGTQSLKFYGNVGDYFTSDLFSFPDQIYPDFSFYYKTSVSNFNFQLVDQNNSVIVDQNLLSSPTSFRKVRVSNFTYDPSLKYKIKIIAMSGSKLTINVDDILAATYVPPSGATTEKEYDLCTKITVAGMTCNKGLGTIRTLVNSEIRLTILLYVTFSSNVSIFTLPITGLSISSDMPAYPLSSFSLDNNYSIPLKVYGQTTNVINAVFSNASKVFVISGDVKLDSLPPWY